MRCALWILFVAGLQGQSLLSPPVQAAPGAKGEAEILWASPAGAEPLALEWDTVVPVDVIEIAGDGLTPGAAAKRAGKSIACSGQWKKAPRRYSYRCMAVGGQRTIGNGVLAVLSFTVSKSAKPGAHRVLVEHAQALSPQMQKIPLKDAAGALRIVR
jgi:hypothetical protein